MIFIVQKTTIRWFNNENNHQSINCHWLTDLQTCHDYKCNNGIIIIHYYNMLYFIRYLDKSHLSVHLGYFVRLNLSFFVFIHFEKHFSSLKAALPLSHYYCLSVPVLMLINARAAYLCCFTALASPILPQMALYSKT